ncbi:MAG: ankyrin repeat domain-containing protein [Acidobacteriaceae bacterium]|nr:ankyrin repeat domain-containing protein [Acidobacteriaceae bacterium]MBV8569202.1 ankyrin repeat domain-containing protein [Acidobacteriaceae bacterium]
MPDLNQFHESVRKGNLEAVRAALTENPALLDQTNDAGQNAFVLAKYYRQEAVANDLLGRRPRLDIFGSCIAGRTDDVVAELDRDPDLLNAHSRDGWTPLHLASFFGWPELANVLVERGASLEARSTNPSSNTPLHAAAAGGQSAVVRLLLEQGADANARQEAGWTALHSAAQAGNRAMVEDLVAHGADVNARAANHQSPLDLALTGAKQEMVTLLEALGAKLQ